MEDRELIIADCSYSGKPVELYSIEKEKHKLVLANESIVDDVKTSLEQSVSFLPFFAELYNISSRLEDYVIIPVVVMASDLPNKNGQAFPMSELLKADPETGQIGYETWARKPTFIDHINKDYTKAKGIVLASTIKPLKKSKGNLVKVVTLLSFDRSRDPILANSIISGERTNYSMGSWAKSFTCSVCNATHTSQHQGCEHISLRMPRMKVFDGKLSYLQARQINGFEVSSVGVGAFASAVTPPSMHL